MKAALYGAIFKWKTGCKMILRYVDVSDTNHL